MNSTSSSTRVNTRSTAIVGVDLCAAAAATIDRLVHDPKKACPEPDPGWKPASFTKNVLRECAGATIDLGRDS
jgi:hypothetical protein